MVTTEVSQLSRECNAWREVLRSHRHQFSQLKHSLQDIAGRQTQSDVLREIEHLDNQFHIQLINIHDVKQSIKNHERKIQFQGENISDETYKEHENLLNEFLSLESMFQELRNDFKGFVSKISCQ